MKKLSYFIPHLILIALLINKKIASHNDSRQISSFSRENHLPEKNIPNTQSLEKSKISIHKLFLSDENFFNETKPTEESMERVFEKNVLLPNYFNLSFGRLNPFTKSPIIRGIDSINENPGKIPVREL